MLITQNILEQYQPDPFYLVVIVDELFGVSLYAFYVVVIERYQDGEIHGTLMTQPFEVYGPFTTLEEARTIATEL